MFLVDTNVISEPTKAMPSEAVVGWLRGQKSVKLSTVSLIEIEYGIARMAKGEKRDRLTLWFEGVLTSAGIELVQLDRAVARSAGRLKQLAEASGRPRPSLDLIVAASAQVTGTVVATRNVSDFEGLGVPLLNPFVG